MTTLTPAQRLAALFPSAALDATTRAEVLTIPPRAAEALLRMVADEQEARDLAETRASSWRQRYDLVVGARP